MALSLRGIALGGGKNSLRETLNSLGDTLSGYFVGTAWPCIFSRSSGCFGCCPELELANAARYFASWQSAVRVDDVQVHATWDSPVR